MDFIDQDLSHSFGVDVKISLGALNVLVSHHFFDLINGSSQSQQVLSVGMPEPIGRRRKDSLFHGFSYGARHCRGPKGQIGSAMPYKDVPVLCFRPGLENISSDGFNGLFGQGKRGRFVGLSFPDGDFSPGKGDVVEGDSADFLGSEPQAIGQVDHGVRSDIHRSRELQA